MSIFKKMFNKDKEESSEFNIEQKQIEKKLKNLNRLRYNNKKILSAVEIENSYFGNGVLVKDSSSDDICYIDVLSGLHFSSFGKKKTASCDLSEFLVKEDNIDYVLASLEKIYEKSDRIMEDAKKQGRCGLVLTCKDKLVDYYAKFGFVNEGQSTKSNHGGVAWNQMRLTF